MSRQRRQDGEGVDAGDRAVSRRRLRREPRGFRVEGHEIAAGPVDPGLHVVATPIGNLGDMTLRGLSTLSAADLILAEDTRVTRVLLDHYGIDTPLMSYHEHNAAVMRPRVLERLARGETLALVSDAGTPLVSDPGYKLVLDAMASGRSVTTAPGASAVMAGLVLSGLPTDRFFFEGFLPAKAAARQGRIRELAAVPGTLVIFEAARRLAETLHDLAALLGSRPACVARELTKKFETVRRDSLSDLAARFETEGPPKGEIVILVAPPEREGLPEHDVEAEIAAALDVMSVKDAAATVAAATGLPRRDIYGKALTLAAKRSG